MKWNQDPKDECINVLLNNRTVCFCCCCDCLVQWVACLICVWDGLDQDEVLRRAVQWHKGKNWKKIGESFYFRPHSGWPPPPSCYVHLVLSLSLSLFHGSNWLHCRRLMRISFLFFVIVMMLQRSFSLIEPMYNASIGGRKCSTRTWSRVLGPKLKTTAYWNWWPSTGQQNGPWLLSIYQVASGSNAEKGKPLSKPVHPNLLIQTVICIVESLT